MSRYTDAVEHNLKGLEAVSTGVCPGCDECRATFDYVAEELIADERGDGWIVRALGDDSPIFASEDKAEAYAREAFEIAVSSGDVVDEGSFSWSECGICGSRLGGTRYDWHAIMPPAPGRAPMGLIHFNDACTDCVVYLANGDEPEEWD